MTVAANVTLPKLPCGPVTIATKICPAAEDEVSGRIEKLLRSPFPAQAIAIMGVAKRWQQAKTANVVAECGTGKTLISLGAIHVHSGGQPYTSLAMVPPHLVEKWAREAFLTIPGIRVFLIDDMRNGGDEKSSHGINEVRLKHRTIVREGLHTNLSDLSSDTSIGAGDVLLGGRSLAGLAPGGSSAGATNVTIPAGTANGSYFIVARADDLNQAFESNEGNNTRALAIRIGPDLRVSSLTAPTYAAAGGTISISDTTANLSASNPAAASTTRFFLSTNTTLDAADVVIGSRTVPALASGASSAGATPVTIPAATATGTYYILAKADGANVLAEKNETNNVSARILRVGPDLVAAVRGIAGTPTVGATISVQDLTSDPSAVATPQSTTGYYLSTDNHLDAGDILIGHRMVPALAGGGSSLASAQAVIPAGTVPGAYYILAVADYPKVIVESNESNNANGFPITVVP